jgi:peptidyl-prolyl cis-trans isomerase D
MLSTMREKTKVVMVILAVAFVGWLVFDVGMGVSGRGQSATPDIGSVNGTPVRYTEFTEAYRLASEQARAENPGVALTLEDQEALEDAAFNSLVQAIVLREEYQRRGITVTDREVVEAVRRFPPAEIQQSPEFQTDGRFDPSKYERFLSTPNAGTREFLIAIERRYREELPRVKLLEQVTSDIYPSDVKLWQIFRDTHESLSVRMLLVRPGAGNAVAAPTVSDEEVRRWYDAHRDDLRRPARAWTSFIAVTKLPTSVDSVAVVEKARALRDSLLRGADFAALARAESSDSASAANGGSLGVFGRGRMVAAFDQAAFSLPVGRISEPVITGYGVHIVRVDRRFGGDSVAASHILIPWARIGARLDTLEARADSLDQLAAAQTNGALLDSVAARMGLTVERPEPIVQGNPVVLGRYRIPNVGVWAFRAVPGETSDVIETNGAYYVFRLDSVFPAGVPSFQEAEADARRAALRDKLREAALLTAQDAERRLAQGRTMDLVGAEMGLPVTSLGPFTRTSQVPVLGSATPAIGAAFRLRAGERSGVLANDEAYFILQAERIVRADSAAWRAGLDEQRAQIIRLARQVRVQSYIQALQRRAEVRDRRDEVFRAPAQAADPLGP